MAIWTLMIFAKDMFLNLTKSVVSVIVFVA